MKKYYFLLITVFMVGKAMANDVVVTNTSLTGSTTTGAQSTHFIKVQFDIAWKNSWRTSTNESNYDGCWLFVKYRKQSTSVWQHATLNASGQAAGTGGTIKIAADGKGGWIYKTADGMGNVSYAANQLQWNYGADGVLDNEKVEIKVFAVEMVYVPQGAYNLGNASADESKFRDGAVDTWFPVGSEAAIACGTGAGQLYSFGNFLGSGTIPAAYPKGFAAFWIMKYEFSKQQHLDFMNTLDQTNADTRNNIGATGMVPNMVVTEPERAAHSFSPNIVLAWLDWAAMRPMSEMEFEKACRGGNNLPSPLEYAWGNTTISGISGPVAQGTATETWTTGNANYFSTAGIPMRCGALATATSNRTASGATFYGAMEMTGNASELTVIANGAGRLYNGAHGDGVLTATAEANTPTWPSSANTYTVIFRGGYFLEGIAQLTVSSRNQTIPFDNAGGQPGLGGRGLRTGE